MNAALLAAGVLAVFAAAYALYSRWLDRRVFLLDPHRDTPAHSRKDHIDYCPTRPSVLFGHHFASICGLGPIIGPAIAALWGWLPALLWIVCGAVVIGAVHDFGALVLSVRYDGRSIGDITNDLIGPRARLLFLVLIFFLIALAMGVFASVIATLFDPDHYPQAVLPSAILIVLAVAIGMLVYRRRVPLGPATAVCLVLMTGSLWLGQAFPITGLSRTQWIVVLLAYAYVASSLPVWVLLQPRDYLNAFQLYAGIGLMYAGLFILRPEFAAPPVNRMAADLPPVFPFLFVTVACGAISGFHSLVCSGTTSKQLDREPHARPIGYGAMLAEASMAVIVLLACTAGVATPLLWHERYSGWQSMQGLGASLGTFIDGGALFVSQVGIPRALASVLISVVVVGFALTTLDSATRLLRYNIEELGRTLGVRFATNRYAASALAVAAIGYFALMKSGKSLWQLFGTTNQLLAALALLAVAAYLAQRRRPAAAYALPMLFMLVTTTTAMTIKLGEFRAAGQTSLWVVSAIVLVLALWLVLEALVSFMNARRSRHASRG
ncbi:MAG TPA: carbon starvation protein A [bacterium]